MKKISFIIIHLAFITFHITAQTLVKATSGAVITVQNGAAFFAEGTITLDNNATLNNDGTVTINGATLQNNGTYTGTGTLNANPFTNSGTVAPSNTAGSLSFNNSFTNAGVLALDINSASFFDKLVVTGTATVGGTLLVNFGTYTPPANQVFLIINASAFAGTFSSINVSPNTINAQYANGILTISTVLPIELLNFSGYTEGGKNHLVWTTTHEVNNRGFYVERTSSPQPPKGSFAAWDVLGFVNTKGKAASYDFLDAAPPSGAERAYYRLRQIDNDGKETLSKVISLSNKAKTTLKMYPNPATDVLTVEFTAPTSARFQTSPTLATEFTILNVLGQIILRGPLQNDKLNQTVDVSILPTGAYIMRIGTEKVKFVKQ